MDVSAAVHKTRRTVSEVERRGQPAKVMILQRQLDAPRDRVWQALTDVAELQNWFLPVRGELAVGRRFEFQGNAGGTVLVCEPPETVLTTWEYGGDTSWVELHLDTDADDETGGSPGTAGTKLTLIHSAHVPPEAWAQFGPGAVGVGWDLTVQSLDSYLAAGDGDEPGWSSEHSRQFHALCSQAWAQASIAAGTAPAEAEAAAERATSFYNS